MSVVTTARSRGVLRLVLALGLLFLYAPIALVILFSFNDSTSTTVWSGMSFRWYDELLQNVNVVQAAGLSVEIAIASASGATILGTLVAFVLARYGRFRGRTLLATMATAPLVMPEIVLGSALLLLFVGMEEFTGWPRHRGFMTITLAHVVYTAAYVTLTVQARLAGIDRSIEEAAADLGATPLVSFFLVTVPLIAPGIMAGWLLGFSISLDDVVITQFASGPGSTTLPLLIFSLVRRGIKPDINAVATIFVVVAVVVAVVLGLLQRRGASLESRG